MPVNLPLPPPPEPVPAPLQARLPTLALELEVAGYRLRVSAPAGVTAAALQEGLQDLRSPVDALRRLPFLVMASGHLSIRTYWLQDADGSLQVWLLPVPLVAVEGDSPLREYFEPLQRKPAPLTPARLEPARTMAGLHARRSGLLAAPRLVPQGEALALQVPVRKASERGSLRLGYGNPGNRYVGRRFLDLDVRTATVGGLEAGLFLRESDRLFQGSDTDYHEQAAGVSQYLPLGLFSLGARHFEYRLRQDDQPLLDGQQTQFELGWLAIPRADFRARWTTELKLDYIDQSLRQNQDGRRVREERYPSLALTVQRTATATLLDRRLDYDISVLLRQGLGSTEGPTASDIDYRLGRTGVGVRWRLLPSLAAEAQLAAQWSDDRLPDAQLWALGGAQFMRAWFPGVALGDRGAYGRLSALYLPVPAGDWQLHPAAHLEWGRSDRDGSPDARLADVAVSLDIRWRQRWNASLGSALPIAEETDPRLRAGARAGFFFRLGADF